MLLRGDYEQCIRETSDAFAKRRYGESWPLIQVEAEMAIGQYDSALKTVEKGIERYSWSIRLRWLGRDAALRIGRLDLAEQRLAEINELKKRFPWRYSDAEELVLLGHVDLLEGKDARVVLDERFAKAKQRNGRTRGPWLAIGGLALDKHDDAFAAETFKQALELFPNDADMHFNMARATLGSDPKRAMQHLETALTANPRHLPTILFQVDRMVDAEAYDEAHALLDQVFAVNRFEPDAWAYRAVLAHLNNDPRGEAAFHDEAMARWSNNPHIDHLIGRKLSQHYRFHEGAAYQRRALAIDANYVRAQRQLAQDLLRLGNETQGWEFAREAHKRDEFNVATFNLLELHDELSTFVELKNESFLVRMKSDEAGLYGREVLDLLNRAKSTLSKKYGLDLQDRITVEIFPNEDDFAVRTFGMPAVSGYLGVCFGKVITANSPASRRESPSNWQAVLWHEFCHVVTLELTRNRIPRWLSEGISVYEELQARPNWGQKMTPKYREHILAGEHTPLGKLSGSFMNPESGWHLQFAYFESALAVEFLISRYGLDSIQNVLRDLRSGLPINVALDRRCGALPKLEQEFDAFIRAKAKSLAPEVDWERPDLANLLIEDNDALEVWVKEHPNSFVGLVAVADRYLEESDFGNAERILKRLISLYPGYDGGDNAYRKLANLYRELNRSQDERRILEQFVAINADSATANLRLIELQTADSDWKSLTETSVRLLEIDPLLRQTHESAALAAEKLDNAESAALALRRVVLLEPDDPADVHYRLARALLSTGQSKEAKRNVLKALEEAPRFRDAHRLLLRIVRGNSNTLPDPKPALSSKKPPATPTATESAR